MTDNMAIKFIYHNPIEFERKDAFITENLYEKYFGRLSVVKMAGRQAVILRRGQDSNPAFSGTSLRSACRLGSNPAERNKKSKWRLFHHLLIFLVRPAGFEPAAYGFEVGFRAKTTGKNRQ